MIHDVIVIGGSYAGMAASLQLLRARRSVLVIDAGQRRNRTASHSHGFLGQDGVDPAVIAHDARCQLEAYPTLTWVEGKAASVTGERDTFVVEAVGNQTYRSRRILFATGVTDHLPEIDGLAERWGKSVFHCPYCHGYELDQGRIGVIASGPMSTHQAELLAEWGTVTFFTNGVLPLAPAAQQALEQKGVTIEDTAIRALTGEVGVQLADGRTLSFAGLFVAPTVTPSTTLPAKLGCTIAEGPMGQMIAVDGAKETTVRGVYACGDVAQMPHSLSFAVGDGAMAGLQLHRSLVWPDMHG
ncbi:NAD(P)/FAD-dependent oxidoreductase [Pacificibacter marinus]|uniref:Thioredoxin reductase n=1 Tax=Pacificibacter marinus TaxID=658057 RepID=A0A1Y5RQX6_9RHOB|nr:NAD(P)/FAD-dependent oxidoreductase [Pacificibacter marinus]SEK17485.1 Thioredoxin reductase [Pacificibacter marinus]SLN20593.1 Alkyl hydroperoxide reductase subunit F [Pacificibacter marinus]